MNRTHSINSIINHLNVFIRRAIYDVVPVGWEIFERIIFDYEIMLVNEGNCYIRIEDREYHAHPGDLVFLKPDVRHRMKSEGKTNLHQPHIHFDLQYDDLSERVYIPITKDADLSKDRYLLRPDVTGKELLNIREFFSLGEGAPYVRNLILSVIDLQNSLDPADMVRKNAYLLELLSFLMKQSLDDRPAISHEKDLFERVNTLIASSYNKPLPLSNICEQIGYSKNYFTHLYKEHFGYTPKQYHEQLRIDKAISYLNMQDINVTEIAFALGFETIHDFSRFFKRKMGVAPSEYRQSLHAKD